MIDQLYEFQKYYLMKVLNNIPEDKLFVSMPNGINSPGWIIVHLIVEIQDIFTHFNTPITPLPEYWPLNFKRGEISVGQTSEELPTKTELIKVFKFRKKTI